MRRAILVGMLALLLGGCGGDDDVFEPLDNDGGFLPQTSPANVLENLQLAYSQTDPSRFEKLFDHESFTFHSDPIDVVEWQIPSRWDWSFEQIATRKLCDSDRVERIYISFDQGEPTIPDEADSPPEGSVKVVVTDVKLIVDTWFTEEGERITYYVERDGAEFYLGEYPDETEEGQPIWKIVEWRDRPVRGLLPDDPPTPTLKITWGVLKDRFWSE